MIQSTSIGVIHIILANDMKTFLNGLTFVDNVLLSLDPMNGHVTCVGSKNCEYHYVVSYL